MVKYAVVDTETTGFRYKGSDRIVEIGITFLDENHQIYDQWQTLVNPERSVGPTHIHGITQAEVEKAPLFADIASELAHKLDGHILAAHNLKFDSGFLEEEFLRATISPPIPFERKKGWLGGIDTVTLARKFIPEGKHNLKTCCETLGITNEHAHSALSDSYVTAQMLQIFLKQGTDQDFVMYEGKPVNQPCFDGLNFATHSFAICFRTSQSGSSKQGSLF